ncbi:MAG: MoaD/ThiS family protein [Candidatus Lokiarchaeota archaeon]|nr:MoaD/ThiS family protein [Candidatus Lokiarchaeota archaeon]
MAKVRLYLLNIFYLRVKKNLLEYEANNIKQLISKFVAEYKDKIGTDFLNTKQNFVNDLIIILLNGRNIRFLKGKKTKLSDNDKIYLSLPVSGG